MEQGSMQSIPKRSMKQYGQMLIKGWNMHQCSPSPRCMRSVVFGGALPTSGNASSARACNRSHDWAHHYMGYSECTPTTYS